MNVSKENSGKITVTFPYNIQLVEKVKTIEGRKWHKDKKYWSFSNTNGTLEKILKVFEGEEIHLDPFLQTRLPHPVIARSEATKQSQENPSLAKPSSLSPSLAKRGEGRFSDKKLSATTFEYLKRELLSRKYNYKTVKGYLYYNRDFLKFQS
ncbi:MAG: hypothetical protein HZC11_00345, partial [Nitrospirae bacterium]|nr:hypothetical protein [Nitrospirota bacterium]